MTQFNLTGATLDEIKTEWSELRAAGNGLDFERAVFLYNVLVEKLDQEVDLLRKFVTNVLEEYAGKRTEKFVRMVEALDKIEDEETWNRLGASGVILLARVDGRSRKKILAQVETTLERTKREAVSDQTFRLILRKSLGAEGYRAILTEQREDFYRGSYKAQAIVLKGQILDLLAIPGVREALTDEARALVGMLSQKADRKKKRKAS